MKSTRWSSIGNCAWALWQHRAFFLQLPEWLWAHLVIQVLSITQRFGHRDTGYFHIPDGCYFNYTELLYFVLWIYMLSSFFCRLKKKVFCLLKPPISGKTWQKHLGKCKKWQLSEKKKKNNHFLFAWSHHRCCLCLWFSQTWRTQSCYLQSGSLWGPNYIWLERERTHMRAERIIIAVSVGTPKHKQKCINTAE